MLEFAKYKLLGEALIQGEEPTCNGKLATIAARIPLEFNASKAEARKSEQTQVEKQVRVRLTVELGFESAVTVAGSEPLLAEAARSVMDSFHVPRTLVDFLRRSGPDKGDRGELIAMLILLRAQDDARNQMRSEQ